MLAFEIRTKFPNFIVQASIVMHLDRHHQFYWTLRLLVCLFIIFVFFKVYSDSLAKCIGILSNIDHRNKHLLIWTMIKISLPLNLTRIMWYVVWQLGSYFVFCQFPSLVYYLDEIFVVVTRCNFALFSS